jgi:phage terminase large subunit-like protein
VPLDEWQEDVLAAAMGERSDGRWASRLVGLSTPRQNGKSQLIVARALAGVLLFEEQTIICSAHQTDTAREVFQRLLDIIDDNPGLAGRVDSVMRALNREYIRFKGGATIRIKARSVSGSRGFSADCLLLDEAQILGTAAWSSILPTWRRGQGCPHRLPRVGG